MYAADRVQCTDYGHQMEAQRNLKFWVDVVDKIASAVPKNLELGFDFWPCSKGDFLTERP
jgi:hypothetical protein